MAFDGAYLHKIKQEIDALAGARIDKISQPTRESVVLALRGFSGGNRRLLISAEAAGAKLHFTSARLENPKAAPMFCMLLRKHLGSGKLLRTEQMGLDRVLSLVFECQNELGDKVEISLVCEIMGRRSNLILVDAQGKVIDAIKRVDFVTSEVRQLLSGITYTLPPAQQKLNPLVVGPKALAEAVTAGRDIPLSKAILEVAEGLSPVLCRELSYRICGSSDTPAAQLDAAGKHRLCDVLSLLCDALAVGGGIPTLVREPGGKAAEFSLLPLEQYPAEWPRESFASFGELLDSFFTGKDVAESMRQRSGDLRKQLSVLHDRTLRKLAAQRQEFLQSQDREQKKQYGDIIAANIYKMNKGDCVLQTVNFFDENNSEISIPLDPMLSPSKNAQRYYNEYRKAATAEQKLRELLANGEQEAVYLESVISELDRAASAAELEAIREEIAGQGYTRLRGSQPRGSQPRNGRRQGRQPQKTQKLPPHRYLSSDGFVILSGRNNLQNDQLTLREAQNYDLWLHTQKIHGSHTVILAQGAREIPDSTIEEAAVIAACNSAAGQSKAKVPVDYTHIKNVKKPRGARPGMVIYETYRTAMVLPDHALAEALRQL